MFAAINGSIQLSTFQKVFFNFRKIFLYIRKYFPIFLKFFTIRDSPNVHSRFNTIKLAWTSHFFHECGNRFLSTFIHWSTFGEPTFPQIFSRTIFVFHYNFSKLFISIFLVFRFPRGFLIIFMLQSFSLIATARNFSSITV